MSVPLSVILPCYNEAGNIAAILSRYRALQTKQQFELILVDNGSTDHSADVFSSELLKPENNFARVVRVEKNIGYGHGLMTGLQQATGQTLAFSHADLQCPPEDLVTALQIFLRQDNGYCLVMGHRRGQRPWLDRMVTWFYNHLAHGLLNLTVQERRCPDINAEPKLFPPVLLKTFDAPPVDFTFDLYVLKKAKDMGLPLIEFDVRYESRAWGKSKLAANPWVRFKTSWRAFMKIWHLKVAR